MALWTIGELAEQAAAALADGQNRPVSSSGRVREVPDARTIRWYQTTGLVDRPTAMRGRTALYGPRQLAQVIAIKRLQSEGRPLAEIQAELAGISDQGLERLAGVPAHSDRPDAPPDRPRFWAVPAEVAGPRPSAAAIHGAQEYTTVTGVRLADDVLLVLETGSTGRTPDNNDLEAVQVAAQPFLDVLRTRGLCKETS